MFIVSGALLIASQSGFGQDKITRKNGTVQEGRVVGATASGVKVEIAVGTAKAEVAVPFADIAAVQMEVPASVKEADGIKDPAAIIAKLEAVVNIYKGLPADWVVDAMARVADAYAAKNEGAKSTAIYEEMAKLYPGSKYLIKANVGRAKGALQAGDTAQALLLLEPLLLEANKKVAPTQAESSLYGEAFLVRGQVLEAKKDLPGALESYVTVTTAFYHNETLAKEAAERADKLRSANKNLTVE
jgi:hypothetical protein